MTSRKLKKLISCVMVLVLAISVMTASAFAAGSLENFAGQRSYRRGLFSDVNESKWYGADQQSVIKYAYEFGLMEGNADGTFAPESNVLICQIITMAARIHNIYNGGTGVFPSGTPWYQPYVDYAVQNSIIPSNYGYDLNTDYAPRRLVAEIFGNALPASVFPALTTITSIPDVDVSDPMNFYIVLFYEAGVLRGSDEAGTFYPNSPITRAETAAIACRLVSPSLRKAPETPKDLVEGYTDQQIADYFVEIAFGGEYEGDSTRLCKWASPIYASVYGSVTDDDWSKMNELFAKLNSIKGFPGIYYADDYGASANLNIYYVPPKEFDQYIVMPDTHLWGYAQYHYFTPYCNIYRGTVLLPSEEANQWYRNSIICEEIVQVLGMTQDSWLYPDSIFYQNSNDTQWPTELDWTVVRLLYNPSMEPGMSQEQARTTALQLIKSWK